MQKIQQIFKKYYTKKILLGPSQALLISQVIFNMQQKCNLLIFGCGNDSPLWANMNEFGYTLFLETSPEWKNECLKINNDLNIEIYNVGNNTVQRSLANDIDDLVVPKCIQNIDWDIIFIDGPAGFANDKPGRALPIIWTSKIKNKNTHIFVDDYERKLEKTYTDKYIHPSCIIKDMNRHFKESETAWYNPDLL